MPNNRAVEAWVAECERLTTPDRRESVQAYRDAAKWAEEHLGVKRLTFHDLRHVALTALADYHDDVIELARTSGHKTLGVLAQYINRSPEEAAKRLREREAKVRSGAA